MSIDVIICSYNRPVYLEQTLSILDKQDCQVIVSDDGGGISIDPRNHPCLSRILWHRHTVYQRVACYNEAMKYVTAENVILLDDDCIVKRTDYIEGFSDLLSKSSVVRGIFLTDHGLDIAPWFSTTNLGMESKLAKELGPFDWRYNGRYGEEDADLGLEIAALGISPMLGDYRTECKHLGEPYSGDRSGTAKNTALMHEKWRL